MENNVMPYAYNRNAFQDGSNASLPILLRTYCSLVALELGCKRMILLSQLLKAAQAGFPGQVTFRYSHPNLYLICKGGQGRSTILALLAKQMADDGYRVLAVDT